MTVTIEDRTRGGSELARNERTLLLIWQDSSRTFVRVGRLVARPDQSPAYTFSYEPGVAQLEGFQPITEFPDFAATYECESLPAFFQNRVMSSGRESYVEYLNLLGLQEDSPELPIEILVRTGGSRATDTYHVVECPPESSEVLSRFFVSGLRHVEGVDALLSELKEGDRLGLERDLENETNPRAVLIVVRENRRIGFVPDWLLGDLYPWLDGDVTGGEAVVERLNRGDDVPWHLRLLCRIEKADRAPRS